jgi:hypothetical protein
VSKRQHEGVMTSPKKESSSGIRLVGRPGLDPGTLGVFPDGPCKSVTVQICWLDEADDPSTCSKMLSDLNSWLDNWLDQIEFMGMVDITFAE